MSGENGTSENAAGATGDNAGSDSTATNGQTTQQDDKGTQTGSGDGASTTSTVKTYSEEEMQAVLNRMKAADKNKSDMEKELEKFRNAGKTELERAQSEAAESKKRADALVAQVRNQALQNAFLSDNTVTWHDPADAFTVLQNHFMEGVEVDENGKVSGMDNAVKLLAKKKGYLVKPAAASEATGSAQNGTRKGENNGGTSDGLKSRFPSIYNR